MQSYRAASPTYRVDVTSVRLDGFIRFRSDRRSFTSRAPKLLTCSFLGMDFSATVGCEPLDNQNSLI
jgi:hypothetical protein